MTYYNHETQQYEVYHALAGGMVPCPENNLPFLGEDLYEMKLRGEYCGACEASDCDHLITGGIHYENPWVNGEDSSPSWPDFKLEEEYEDEEEPMSYDDPDNHHPVRQPRADRPRTPRPERPQHR